MPTCIKCHTKMSTEKYAHHKKRCIPDGKKGMTHFRDSKSFAVDEHGNRITKK